MKSFLYVVGAILILAGGLFALQGMALVPSRIMYGKQEWIVIGTGMVIVGAAIIFFQRRGKKQ